MATYFISHPGNTAIQSECWIIPTAEAKQALAYLKPGTGTYYEGLAKSYRRARRAHEATCRFTTGGFTTAELANILRSLDIDVAERPTY